MLGLRLAGERTGGLLAPVFRLVPITEEDTAELLAGLPGRELLDEATVSLAQEVLERLAMLADADTPIHRLQVCVSPLEHGPLVQSLVAELAAAAEQPPVRRLRRPGAPSWPLR